MLQNFRQFFNFWNSRYYRYSSSIFSSLNDDARCKKRNSEDFRVHPQSRGSYFNRKMEKRIFYVQDLILIVRFERYTWQRRIRDSKGAGEEEEDRFGSCSIVSWPGNRLRHVSWNTFSRLHWSQVESVPSRKTKNAIYPSKTRDSCSRFGTKYFNAIASNHTWR